MFGQVKAYKTPEAEIYYPFEVLAEQPHLLIAGATGAGKSVTLNGIITTIISKHSPALSRFILIDPKRVELFQYAELPHVVNYSTEPAEIENALRLAVNETERRYKDMQQKRLRDYDGCNLYVIIDELADLMIANKKNVLPLLQKIAAIGRAAKVHLIVCTQSVLVEFLPSSIRCNIPVTVGLRTANKAQSRFLINSPGCELLPDPKTAGCGYAIIRDGANLEKIRIHKYSDCMINRLLRFWTSQSCIA